MTTLTLVQERSDAGSLFSLRSLVESALDSEIQSLEDGLRRTQERIRSSETQYGFSTDEFLAKFAQNQLQHSDDFDEWVGESRMLAHLQSKLARIQGIQIVD